MRQQQAVLLLKVVLWLSALAPAAYLVLGMFVYPDWVGANPIEKLTHVTGMTTLVLLLHGLVRRGPPASVVLA